MHLLRHFTYDHLPAGPLRETSALFAALADALADALPDGPEKTTAMRKLLEARYAAVSAALDIIDTED